MPGGLPTPRLGTTWSERLWSLTHSHPPASSLLWGLLWVAGTGLEESKGGWEEQEEGGFPRYLVESQAAESPHKVSLSSDRPRVPTSPQWDVRYWVSVPAFLRTGAKHRLTPGGTCLWALGCGPWRSVLSSMVWLWSDVWAHTSVHECTCVPLLISVH